MTCIICSDKDFLIEENETRVGLPLVRCKTCDLLYILDEEKKLPEMAKDWFKDEYWDKRDKDASELDFKSTYSLSKKRTFDSAKKYCQKFLDGKKSLFDLGAGPGYALYWFEELGFKVNGIEPAPQYVKKINEKLKIGKCINGFAEDMNVDGKFDVVWISGVLHRTFRPDIVLQKVREILNDDGFVYINVPNIENPTYRKLGPKQNTNSFHFTKKTLSKLLKSTGFKTEKIDCFRSLKKHEGGINRVWSRYLKLEKNKLYPYYPQKLVDETEGTRIRGIFTKE